MRKVLWVLIIVLVGCAGPMSPDRDCSVDVCVAQPKD